MESDRRNIYCKYCGHLCVKKISKTKDNPGRSSWACLIEWGGHGWMEWVDYTPSQEKRVSQMEKIITLERLLDKAEIRVEELVDENKILKEELKKKMVLTRCLKKVLKGICIALCLATTLIIIVVATDGINNVALAP